MALLNQKSLSKIRILTFISFFFCINLHAQTNWHTVGSHLFNRAINTLYTDSVSNLLYIGGNFKFYDTVMYNGCGSWNGTEMNQLGCGLGGCSSVSCGGVYQFELFNNELYALYFEDSVGCSNIHHIAKWTGLSWIDLNQEFFYNSNPIRPNSMLNLDSVLLVSGGYDSIRNFSAQGNAYYNGTSWSAPLLCSFFVKQDLLISPVVKYHDTLFAQNLMRDTLGNYQIFSKWNGSCWEKLNGVFSNFNGSIKKMIVFNDELYVAGNFSTLNDPLAPGKSIARWNGMRWDDLNGGLLNSNLNYPATVNDLSIYNNELYVVGDFQKAGNLNASNIAKWNGNSWCILSSHFDNPINNIAFYNDSLFVGGNFKKIDNDSIFYFAKRESSSFDTCETASEILDINQFNFDFFPSPTNSVLNIKSQFEITKVIIFDIQGRIVKSLNQNSSLVKINVFDLENGLYIAEIYIAGKKFNRKFIKD